MTVLDRKEKLSILLAEYNVLRAQMLQRNGIINQLFSTFGTIVIAVISYAFTRNILVGVVLLICWPPVLIVVYRLNKSDMYAAAERIKELYVQINECAGESLLKSETASGRSTIGNQGAFGEAFWPFNQLARPFANFWRRYVDSK
jgi:hypothetical protein